MRPPNRLGNHTAHVNDPQFVGLLLLPVRKRVRVGHDDFVDRIARLDFGERVAGKDGVGGDQVDPGGATFDENFGGFGERPDRVDNVVLCPQRIE